MDEINNGIQFILPYDILMELLGMPVRDRMKGFEAFCKIKICQFNNKCI